MALVVLDSSAVIAFLDPEDTLHERAVPALAEHRHDEFVIPASVYAEILVGPYRRGSEAVAEVEAFLADLDVRVEAITAAIARAAARLRSGSRSLRLPDALVIATADEIDAGKVLTGDASLAGISPRVTLIRSAPGSTR